MGWGQREGQLREWLFGAGRGCAPGGRGGRWELHALPSWAETQGSSRVSERAAGVPASPTGSKCSPGSRSAGPGERRAICFPSADSLGPAPPSGACCTPASLPVSGNGKTPRAAQRAGTTVSVAFRPHRAPPGWEAEPSGRFQLCPLREQGGAAPAPALCRPPGPRSPSDKSAAPFSVLDAGPGVPPWPQVFPPDAAG